MRVIVPNLDNQLSVCSPPVFITLMIVSLIQRPITVDSESSDHSRITALMCIDFVIKEVENHIAPTKVVFCSDACAVQFKSRFVFKLISTYHPDLLIDWHYNEAHYGKRPMDRIGGTIKNFVFRQVKSGQIIINSAEDFCKAAKQFCPSTTTLLQKSGVILREPSDIEEAPTIQERVRFTSSEDALPRQPEKPKSIFSSYRIARNLFTPKNSPPKKDTGT